MNIDLSGKTAPATGGSKGIGKAIAQTLAVGGADEGLTHLDMASRNEEGSHGAQ